MKRNALELQLEQRKQELINKHGINSGKGKFLFNTKKYKIDRKLAELNKKQAQVDYKNTRSSIRKYIGDGRSYEEMKAAIESGPKKRASLNKVVQLTNNDLQQMARNPKYIGAHKRLVNVNTVPLESMKINNIKNYQRRLKQRKNERKQKIDKLETNINETRKKWHAATNAYLNRDITSKPITSPNLTTGNAIVANTTTGNPKADTEV